MSGKFKFEEGELREYVGDRVTGFWKEPEKLSDFTRRHMLATGDPEIRKFFAQGKKKEEPVKKSVKKEEKEPVRGVQAEKQCEAETASGKRCKNKAIDGENFCSIHLNAE